MNNLNTKDIIITKVEKNVYEGYGLAKVNNFPVFIENSVVGDLLKIKLTKINKSFAFGKIEEILEKSPFRIKPACPYFEKCGGCLWQNIDYNTQLLQKKIIILDSIKKVLNDNILVKDVIGCENIFNTRSKIQLPIRKNFVSGNIHLGYFQKKSHNLVNINFCPMAIEKINELIPIIKKEAQNISIYDELKHIGLLKHIIFRYSHFLDKILLILVVNSKIIDKNLQKLINNLSKLDSILEICINFNDKKTNVILGSQTKSVYKESDFIEKIGNIKYKISANSFFQVNIPGAFNILNTVKNIIKENFNNPTILDAYSGVGTFSLFLSDIAKEIFCVEEVESAYKNSLENIKLNNLTNIYPILGDVKDCFESFKIQNIKFDISIIDPPRAGSSEFVLNNLALLTKKLIIYVSCNPSTLARDLKILKNFGFIAKYIQPIDMFCNTYHIESVCVIEKIY